MNPPRLLATPVLPIWRRAAKSVPAGVSRVTRPGSTRARRGARYRSGGDGHGPDGALRGALAVGDAWAGRRARRVRVEAPATPDERRRLRFCRRFGFTGSLLMAVGALGCGAAPASAYNPVLGDAGARPARPAADGLAHPRLRRHGDGGAGVAVARAGWPGPAACGSPPPAHPHPRHVGRAARRRAAAVLHRRLRLPLAVRGGLARLRPLRLRGRAALGLNDPLVASIPTIWRTTPSPYGPGFLTFGRLVTAIAGDDIVLGVYLHRVLALFGIGLVIWAAPHLARRAGVEPIAALWLAISPLVLFHLVSGIHNDAIMLGVVFFGLEIGFRRSWFLGAVIIGLGASGKIPAILALAFLAAHVARERCLASGRDPRAGTASRPSSGGGPPSRPPASPWSASSRCCPDWASGGSPRCRCRTCCAPGCRSPPTSGCSAGRSASRSGSATTPTPCSPSPARPGSASRRSSARCWCSRCCGAAAPGGGRGLRVRRRLPRRSGAAPLVPAVAHGPVGRLGHRAPRPWGRRRDLRLGGAAGAARPGTTSPSAPTSCRWRSSPRSPSRSSRCSPPAGTSRGSAPAHGPARAAGPERR